MMMEIKRDKRNTGKGEGKNEVCFLKSIANGERESKLERKKSNESERKKESKKKVS